MIFPSSRTERSDVEPTPVQFFMSGTSKGKPVSDEAEGQSSQPSDLIPSHSQLSSTTLSMGDPSSQQSDGTGASSADGVEPESSQLSTASLTLPAACCLVFETRLRDASTSLCNSRAR